MCTDIIRRCGILISLNGADLPSTYSLLHATRTIDALDWQASDCSRFLDGRINQLRKPVFRTELLQEEWLFRIPGYRAGIFATQRFKELVESVGLTGFEFAQIYPQPDDATERLRFLEKRVQRRK
jgi:hypothetical protein